MYECVCVCFVTSASYDDKISCWSLSRGKPKWGLTRVHQITSFSMLVLCMKVSL